MNQIPNIEEIVKDALIQYARSEKGEWGMCLDFAEKTILKAHNHQLQKALAEGYEQGYTQGKFNEKMDAEYKHPEELQKARQDWLQEEIHELRGWQMKVPELQRHWQSQLNHENAKAHNQALQTIIDRYQAELNQDNK